MLRYQEKFALDDDGEVVAVLRCATVGKRDAGEPIVTFSGVRELKEGDVVIASSNPAVSDVLTKEEYGELGLYDDPDDFHAAADDTADADSDVVV